MWNWITFLLVLFLALVLSYLTATATGFIDYVFVPMGWRRRWGPGWRRPWWRRRWAPRYVTYVEPFANLAGEIGSRQGSKAAEPFASEAGSRQGCKATEPFGNEAENKDKKEAFENKQIEEQKKIAESQGKKNFERRNEKDLTDIDYPDLYNQKPYHLLGDEMEPLSPEKISCVNSRSCYATSFDRFLEQTGNFHQITNNYKRGYPDSCSSPLQELVLSFYKTQPLDMQRPTNCL